MSGIDGDRREQRLYGLCIKGSDVRACGGPQRTHVHHTNRLCNEPGNEIIPPAIVLSFYESVDSSGELDEHFARRAAIRSRIFDAVFDLLQEACDAHFDEFVQIARSDSEKFHALEERILGVARFFQYALVELQPGKMAIQK
jgi:hypothetical protein